MRNATVTLALALTFILAKSPAADDPAGSAAVSFRKDIAPILVKKCVTCHGPEKSKGAYRLDTFELLLRSGESKSPAILPGKPEESQLYQRVTAKDEDDRMPQKDDPLPSEQIAQIERWIKAGASFDGPDPKAALVLLIPRAPHPDPPVVYRHPVPILALAFSPDGQEVAAGGYNEVTIWGVADGKLQRRIKNVAQRTQSLAYNPDGTLLAVAGGIPGQLGEVALFDPRSGSRSGKEAVLIQQHADWVMSLAWNHDGTLLASASRDRTARIYNTETGELETTYAGHQGPVYAVAFSVDGKLAYSAGREKKIHFWETKDGKKSGELEAAEEEIYRLAVSGGSIFSCSADRQIRQYSAEKKELTRTCSGHRDCVYALTVHEGTNRLATGSYDGEVRVWNTQDGQLLAAFFAAPGYRPPDANASAGSRE